MLNEEDREDKTGEKVMLGRTNWNLRKDRGTIV